VIGLRAIALPSLFASSLRREHGALRWRDGTADRTLWHMGNDAPLKVMAFAQTGRSQASVVSCGTSQDRFQVTAVASRAVLGAGIGSSRHGTDGRIGAAAHTVLYNLLSKIIISSVNNVAPSKIFRMARADRCSSDILDRPLRAIEAFFPRLAMVSRQVSFNARIRGTRMLNANI